MRRFLSGLMNGSLALALIGAGMIIANQPAKYLDLGPNYFEAFAAQGSLCQPTTGTVSGLTLSQNINTAFNAIVSSNSGTSAPANACTAAAVKGQWWLDTSLTPNLLKMYDGTSWLSVGAMDATGHKWWARADDGALSTPGFAFTSETNTGIRRAGANDMRIVIGGVDILQITSSGATVLAGTFNAVPVGTVNDYCGATEPSGWIFGYGQAVSRTGATASLFSVYGTTFGIGNGTSTFNVPDFRGRVIAAPDNMGGTAASILSTTYYGVAPTSVGAKGGVESTTFAQANLPAINWTRSGALLAQIGGVQANAVAAGAGTTSVSTTTLDTQVYAVGVYGNVTINLSTLAFSSGGSATPFSRVQPTILCNKIIKL